MRARARDVLATAIAPMVWGSTYIVTTEYLAGYFPITVAALRVLPAGLLLLLVVRQLPTGIWWLRAFILGALNIAVFQSLLFVSAYRLPGGVAATLGAVQPLIVAFLAPAIIGGAVRKAAVIAAVAGMAGVALLVLTPKAELDALGVAAGLAAAAAMALASVLARKWQAPVSPLTTTAWQLTAGGILLVPAAYLFEPAMTAPTATQLLALAWLGLVGAALAYMLWFRGVARLDPSTASSLLFVSPLSAVALGWAILGQALSPPQIAGVAVVIGSVWLGVRSAK